MNLITVESNSKFINKQKTKNEEVKTTKTSINQWLQMNACYLFVAERFIPKIHKYEPRTLNTHCNEHIISNITSQITNEYVIFTCAISAIPCSN